MSQKIPLEEAMASVDFPVFGLPEEVFGLCYTDYTSFSNIFQPFTLNYQSERYAPLLHEKIRSPTLSVHSHKIPSPSQLKMYNMLFHIIQKEDADVPEQDCRNIFDLKSRLIIDGAHFTGSIAYRPAPLYRSQFSLQRERVCLFGQAYGPTFDELIQILEALRVLNGKPVD